MVIFVLFGLLISYNIQDVVTKSKIRNFPKSFEFGISTAAYQIEGGWNEDGKGLTVWDVLTHSNSSPVIDNSNGDIAADSYHLYKRDVEMVKELGLDFYRFSISWSRILPTGFTDQINEAGVNYYNNLINELLDKNIQPFATLYHWDLPYNLQKLGGWVNPNIIKWFEDYAEIVFKKFGDRVKRWTTVNEPKQICFERYGVANKIPPQNETGVNEYKCVRNFLLSHAKVYRLYDEKFRPLHNGTIGIAISSSYYEPVSNNFIDKQAAVDAMQFDWGIYAHPIFSKTGDFPIEVKRKVAKKSELQGFPKSRLPVFTAEEVALIKGSSDFLGINSYSTKIADKNISVLGKIPIPSHTDDMGCALVIDPSWTQASAWWLQEVPWGFYKLLIHVKNLYNPVIHITENGWSNIGGLADDDRIRYFKNYLNAMLDAIEEGCDVRSYSAWSLMDNFEWHAGYSDKFGLYEVDFSSPERIRTPKKSASFYKELARTRELDFVDQPRQTIGIFNSNNIEENNKILDIN